MAFTEIVIDDKEVNKWLSQFKGNLDRLSTLFQRSADVMLYDINQHFQTDHKSSDGKPWAPLKSGKPSILQDTGRLFGSLTKSFDNTNAMVSAGVEYANRHNFGFRSTPQREFMWISDKALEQITNIFEREIVPV